MIVVVYYVIIMIRCRRTAVSRPPSTPYADIAPDAVRSENDHRPMVLIVDDSPMNRDILSEILCDDFEILEAPNAPNASSF